MAGEDFERAAELVELAVPVMRQNRQEATLRRWLEALPGELYTDRPVLSIALVGARMASNDPTAVEPLLDRAQRWLDGTVDGATPVVFDTDEYARLPAQIAVFRAALALLAGDTAATLTYANRARELVAPTDHFGRGASAALVGLAHWAVGDLDTARRRYAEAVDCFVEARFVPDVLGCSLALADIQVAQGRLRDARRTFEAGLAHARAHVGLRGTADMHVGLAEVSIEQNELDDAERHLDESAQLGAHAGLPQHAYRSRVVTARLREARGDLTGALELLDDAERVYNTDFSPAVRPIAALRARVWLARGDVAAALGWATDRGLTADDELDYVREFEHLTLARVLLARHGEQRAIADAIRLLERLLAAAEAGTREGSVVEILVLLSVARERAGDAPASLAALEAALRRAEPEGHVRVFAQEGAEMAARLRNASRHGPARDHARRMLAALGDHLAPAPAPAGLVDELSERELQVLRLLRSDLSGPDIARELTVSLNTVRTHTKHIYTKLGVTNRREAVRRAAELGF
jgi:LuxR family maltose regulon positive regulatory protein